MELIDIATERLEAELVAHAAWENQGLARFLDLLFEYDRREAWGSWGCVSMQHWLSWKCGLGTVAASERLRVARALQHLPAVRQAFHDGFLSYSKVREITRVATPDSDATWAEITRYMTAGQVAKLARAARRVTRGDDLAQIAERRFRWSRNDSGGVTISVDLPAEIGATVVAAVKEATVPERGVPIARSQADAFVELVLARTEVAVEVVAHVSPDGHGTINDHPISRELTEWLACDGAVTTVTDTPHGPIERDRRPAPNRAQRRYLQRRHPSCQFPGCPHTAHFEAHHVIERSKGGKTELRNLAWLCWIHHRMVHLLKLVLTLHPDRTLTVATADGRLIERPIPWHEFQVDPPVDPNRLGGLEGDRMDLGYLVAAVVGT
jgi:hypothetical protein